MVKRVFGRLHGLVLPLAAIATVLAIYYQIFLTATVVYSVAYVISKFLFRVILICFILS